MALQKSKTVHGITGNYWQIANKNYIKDTGKTSILLRCYVSAEVRAAGLGDFIGMPEFQEIKEFEGDLTTAQCYTQAKASVMSEAVGIEGEEGYVAPAETNFFVDAMDI